VDKGLFYDSGIRGKTILKSTENEFVSKVSCWGFFVLTTQKYVVKYPFL